MGKRTRILWLIALSLAAGHLSATDDEGMQHLRISTEMRTDYRNDLGYPGTGVTTGDNGLRVNNLFLRIDGRIDDHVTYAFRQRLNRMNPDPSVMASIDWAQLIWSPNERWSFAAGKQVMEVGSMEYDANPNDVFRYSEWIQQAQAYQLGASVTRRFGTDDEVIFQITQSLCDNEALHRYFSYNASWRHTGTGVWRPYYSVNLHQYAPRSFMAMTALGNRFYFGRYWFCLDWVQRSTLHYIRTTGRPAEDFTIIGCADWRVTDHVTLTRTTIMSTMPPTASPSWARAWGSSEAASCGIPQQTSAIASTPHSTTPSEKTPAAPCLLMPGESTSDSPGD